METILKVLSQHTSYIIYMDRGVPRENQIQQLRIIWILIIWTNFVIKTSLIFLVNIVIVKESNF